MVLRHWLSSLAPISVSLALSTEGWAQAPASGYHADVELDPIAYALDGYSLHVGLGWQRWRLDLGAFAMTIPEAIHGNADFDVSFDGYGAKLQWFALAEQEGLVLGIDGGLVRVLVQRKGQKLADRDRAYTVGTNLGYRVNVIDELYVTPWIGVGYALSAKDVTLDEATFTARRWQVFPAIHLGYRLR